MSKNTEPNTRLREFRLAKGWTQAEVAKLTGFSQPTVQRHEADRRNLDGVAIERYALIYGVKPHEVFVK